MRRRLTLAGLLAPPLLWLVVAYLGALAAIFATAFWTTDPFTNEVVQTFTPENFELAFTDPTYLRIIGRTVLIATAVTVLCIVVAVPTAFLMAKVAPPRVRGLLVALVLVPLWASYLVKAYAWRGMLSESGPLSWLGLSPGYGLTGLVITLAYLWLPYMILPVYAGLQKLPGSLLEASSDLGAPALTTFRRVVLPSVFPALVAGSIFTFSLTMGDYIAVKIVGGPTQMLGNVVADNYGVANNLPFAAAYAVVPVLVMLGYLAVVRRTGALESL
jgi:putative spermidine/putrescine transport system permease protein